MENIFSRFEGEHALAARQKGAGDVVDQFLVVDATRVILRGPHDLPFADTARPPGGI
jgi:hypothetical protein